jgi:hypothetical protein
VAQCGNVGKVAAVGLIDGYGVDIFLGGAQFLQSFNNGCSQEVGLCIRRNVALRSIEEGFLDCVARLVRRNERERKDRATPLEMSGLARKCGLRDRFKQQVPYPLGKAAGFGMTRSGRSAA